MRFCLQNKAKSGWLISVAIIQRHNPPVQNAKTVALAFDRDDELFGQAISIKIEFDIFPLRIVQRIGARHDDKNSTRSIIYYRATFIDFAIRECFFLNITEQAPQDRRPDIAPTQIISTRKFNRPFIRQQDGSVCAASQLQSLHKSYPSC